MKFLIIFALFFLSVAASVEEGLSEHKDISPDINCADLGFTDSLLCSQCDGLEEVVPDADLINECRQCCVADVKSEKFVSYHSAELAFWPWALDHYPHIKEFVNKHASEFKRLTLSNKRTSPSLFLYSEQGELVERLSLDQWKTEDLIEFLQNKLRKNEDKAQ